MLVEATLPVTMRDRGPIERQACRAEWRRQEGRLVSTIVKELESTYTRGYPGRESRGTWVVLRRLDALPCPEKRARAVA
jgi:hypothetical protein